MITSKFKEILLWRLFLYFLDNLLKRPHLVDHLSLPGTFPKDKHAALAIRLQGRN
jgi:hypothetical protein